eukprot:SAG22_NODE_55_length_23749_cov_24.622918_5_plen_624_part_00
MEGAESTMQDMVRSLSPPLDRSPPLEDGDERLLPPAGAEAMSQMDADTGTTASMDQGDGGASADLGGAGYEAMDQGDGGGAGGSSAGLGDAGFYAHRAGHDRIIVEAAGDSGGGGGNGSMDESTDRSRPGAVGAVASGAQDSTDIKLAANLARMDARGRTVDFAADVQQQQQQQQQQAGGGGGGGVGGGGARPRQGMGLGAISIHPSVDAPGEQRQKMNRLGYIQLRSGTVIKSWQRRYFVLEENKLTIYKHHTDVGVKFSRQLEMAGVTVQDSADQPGSNPMEFSITVAGETLMLRTNSPAETQAWVYSTRYCAAVLKKRQASGQISDALAKSSDGRVTHISQESIAIEDIYEMGEVLGAGVAGTVYRAVHRTTGEACAIKVLSKRKFLHSARGKITVARELEILTQLSETNHPNVVQLKAIIENVASLYIVMEVVEGGELFQCIVRTGSYSEPDAAKVTKTMCETVLFLHQNGIVHRDLKPENILLSTSDDHLNIKITDFGLSHRHSTLDAAEMLSSKCGTPMYMAPEVHQGKPYTANVDIWAIGVIMYVLLSGTLPFYAENSQDFVQAVVGAQYEFPDEEWADISDQALDLIERILEPSPDNRISLQHILGHPWITQHTT